MLDQREKVPSYLDNINNRVIFIVKPNYENVKILKIVHLLEVSNEISQDMWDFGMDSENDTFWYLTSERKV